VNTLVYAGAGVHYPINTAGAGAKLSNYLTGPISGIGDVSRVQAQAQLRAASNYSPMNNHLIMHVLNLSFILLET
jgi:hypothetical protein